MRAKIVCHLPEPVRLLQRDERVHPWCRSMASYSVARAGATLTCARIRRTLGAERKESDIASSAMSHAAPRDAVGAPSHNGLAAMILDASPSACQRDWHAPELNITAHGRFASFDCHKRRLLEIRPWRTLNLTISMLTPLCRLSVCLEPRVVSYSPPSSSSRILARAASVVTDLPGVTRAPASGTSNESGPEGLVADNLTPAGRAPLGNP